MQSKIKRKDLLIERDIIRGSWQISTMHNGYLRTKTYYGYTKRESIECFIDELNNDNEAICEKK
jgi:hypothetical protein